MTLIELLAVMIAAGGAYFIWANLRARETANAAIREACAAEHFLFLNDTVGLESMWLARDAEGRLRLRRLYGFEYSGTGSDRRRGSVTMIGDAVSIVDLGILYTPHSESMR